MTMTSFSHTRLLTPLIQILLVLLAATVSWQLEAGRAAPAVSATQAAGDCAAAPAPRR